MYSKITISGKICTGKSSVFRQLLKQLKWPTFSSGAYFREYSKTHNLELNNAEEQTDILTRKVDGMVKEMLHKPGHLLLDAWLGGVLAEGTHDVLKVLLTADDSTRFKRFADREKVSLDVAKQEVLLRDSSWFEKVKKIHNRSDFFDKENYNLIIDTSNVNVEYVVSTILKNLS
ncbi:MAG: cytidylate kinase family protein [Candidatus Roizmanbacteria bacterium]|nr:cytidylate kinase family protein [Candidatus Roizmanbacteria bacterium]